MTGMKKNIGHKAPMLAYQFAFGSDERLYTVAFKGILTEPETRQMFGILRKTYTGNLERLSILFLKAAALRTRIFPQTHPSWNTAAPWHLQRCFSMRNPAGGCMGWMEMRTSFTQSWTTRNRAEAAVRDAAMPL